ncbi:MAG: hypothetical protein M3N32_12015 [Actinomycetota bacterium]|nr:hypothetical protein [Actinomycetota bacterium]
MVEQRAYNRVIQDVGERLASLESGLRSLWETTSSQGLALRSELQDGLANVAEDVDSRSRVLTQEVERLQASSADHATRLGELARAAEQAIGALGEGQARLAEELVRLERNVAASTEQTSNIPDLVASQLQRLEAIVSEVEGHVRHALESGIGELERVANRDGGVDRKLEDLTSRVDEGMALLGQRLIAVEQRVDSHEEAVARATSAVAGQVTETLEASERRRAGDAADSAQALRAALSERIHAVETRLDQHFSGLGYGIDERLAELASVMTERVGEQVDAARDAVDESRDALASEIVNLSSRLRQALVALGEAAARDAADTREAAAAAADHVGQVATRVAKLEEYAATIVETPSRAAVATIEVFRPFLEDFRSALVVEQREELAASLRQVRAVTSGVTEEIEELQILAAALRQAQTGDEERLAAVRDDLLARVEGLLVIGLGHMRDNVEKWAATSEEEGRVLRSAVEERLDLALATLQERLAEIVGTERMPEVLSGHHQDLLGTLGQFEDAVAERLGVSEEAGRNLFAAIDERLRDAEHDGRMLRAAIEERLHTAEEEGRVLRSAVEERLDLALATFKERLGEIVGTVDERIPEVLSSHREDLLGNLEQFEATVAERLGVPEEEGRALLQALEERLGANEQGVLPVAIEERVYEAVSALEERLEQVGIALDERLPEVLAGHENEVAATLQAAFDEASERLDAADEIFRTAVGKLDDLPPDLDSRIARVLDRAVETARSEARSAVGESHTALARLTEIQATLTGLEGSLLAYLGAFDARLERERARVLAKLGEELAEGLSRRERKRLVGRLSSAREADTPHEVSSSAPWSPPVPLSPEPKPESDPPDPAPSGPSRPSMRPGLLSELLGEEPPARPEPVVPRTLRPGGEVQITDEERTEQAPRGQALDSGVATPAGPPPDEVKTTSFICPTCGFSARSAAGLTSHRRRHA